MAVDNDALSAGLAAVLRPGGHISVDCGDAGDTVAVFDYARLVPK